MTRDDGRTLYGIVAEFETPDEILDAARQARKRGYRKVAAYTPFQVEGLAELVGFRFNWLAPMILIAGFSGAAIGFFMQWYANVYSYPVTVAGRPHNSWPSFIPITFELAVLSAALTAIFGLFALCGLPCPYHPIFSAPNIGRIAGAGRFFLCIESKDDVFREADVRRFLEALKPCEVHDVWD
jgi:hypothetical protein